MSFKYNIPRNDNSSVIQASLPPLFDLIRVPLDGTPVDELKLYQNEEKFQPANLEATLLRGRCDCSCSSSSPSSSTSANESPPQAALTFKMGVTPTTIYSNELIRFAALIGNVTFLNFVWNRLTKDVLSSDSSSPSSSPSSFFLSGTKAGETIEKFDGSTLTCDAAWTGNVDVLRFLHERKLLEPLVYRVADDKVPLCKFLPFHVAVREGHVDCVTFFVEEIVEEGNTNDDEASQFRLTNDNPNCYRTVTASGQTNSIISDVFLIQGATKQVEMLKYLLPKSNGCKFDKETYVQSAFACACKNNNKAASSNGSLAPIELLVEYGFHEACLREATTVSRLKVRKLETSEVKHMEQFDRDLHQLYLKYEFLPVAHESLFVCGDEAKVPVAVVVGVGATPPLVLAEKRRQQLVSAYLMTMAKRRSRENSPVHLAAEHQNLPLLRYLFSEKLGFAADVNGKVAKAEATPLALAVRGCHNDDIGVVKFLVDEGHADINLDQKDGATPLYIGTYFGKTAAVRFLLERNANGSKMFDKRATPFVGAIASKNLDMVKLLIEMNCDTSTKRLSETPLEYSRKLHGDQSPITRYIAQHA